MVIARDQPLLALVAERVDLHGLAEPAGGGAQHALRQVGTAPVDVEALAVASEAEDVVVARLSICGQRRDVRDPKRVNAFGRTPLRAVEGLPGRAIFARAEDGDLTASDTVTHDLGVDSVHAQG